MCDIAIMMPSASAHGHGNLRIGPQLDNEGRIETTTSLPAAPPAAQSPMPQNEEELPVGPEDILCGRGAEAFNHIGNKRFRKTIANAIGRYSQTSSRSQRSLLAQSIFESIQRRGGKFLKKLPGSSKNKTAKTDGRYQEIPDQAALEKISHALRDAYVNVVEKNKRNARRYMFPGGAPNTMTAPGSMLAQSSNDASNFAFMGLASGGQGGMPQSPMEQTQSGLPDSGTMWPSNMQGEHNQNQQNPVSFLGGMQATNPSEMGLEAINTPGGIGPSLMNYQRSIIQAMNMDCTQQSSIIDAGQTQIPHATSCHESVKGMNNVAGGIADDMQPRPLLDLSPMQSSDAPSNAYSQSDGKEAKSSNSKKTDGTQCEPIPLSAKEAQPAEIAKGLRESDSFDDFISNALGPLEPEDYDQKGLDDFFRHFSTD